jgi:hypothetical protein
MRSKIVTAMWMGESGYPFQGSNENRKNRYLGSLIAHCQIGLPVICYTNSKTYDELVSIQKKYSLDNLTIKILELSEIKFHNEISSIRDEKYENNYENEFNGRGIEILWGKFDVIERELVDCDNIYWVDVGLQHPGIFPWMYCLHYGDEKCHYGETKNEYLHVFQNNDISQYNFTKLFNGTLFDKLNELSKDKIFLVLSCFLYIS